MKIFLYFLITFTVAYPFSLEEFSSGNQALTQHLLSNTYNTKEDTEEECLKPLRFKDSWVSPFDPALTANDTFFTSEESTVEASMMFRNLVVVNYYEDRVLDAQILEIPLSSGAVITLALPNKKEGIDVLKKNIHSLVIQPTLTLKVVDVKLPRIKHPNFTLNENGVYVGVGPKEVSGIAGKPSPFLSSSPGIDNLVVIIGKPFKADHPFIVHIHNKRGPFYTEEILIPEY